MNLHARWIDFSWWLSLLLVAHPCFAQESSGERDARMGWWREARFGLFVHWGLYSGLAGTWEGKPVGKSGGMEWIQQRVHGELIFDAV